MSPSTHGKLHATCSTQLGRPFLVSNPCPQTGCPTRRSRVVASLPSSSSYIFSFFSVVPWFPWQFYEFVRWCTHLGVVSTWGKTCVREFLMKGQSSLPTLSCMGYIVFFLPFLLLSLFLPQ
ncbi:hypothetical protein CDAR_571341 [Caerostris darwini]|uniref:Uncharacterized protein n=1 Tax=Caerostris darwini TaxID=1538125 RepID=A0AAV4SJ00_9ARAC|nr:hypothetical protein CDAR_571341 [Caerostris darwini]